MRSLHELRLRLAWHQTGLLNGNETSGRLNVRLLCCSVRVTTKHTLLCRQKLLLLLLMLLLLLSERVRQLLLACEVRVESDQCGLLLRVKVAQMSGWGGRGWHGRYSRTRSRLVTVYNIATVLRSDVRTQLGVQLRHDFIECGFRLTGSWSWCGGGRSSVGR